MIIELPFPDPHLLPNSARRLHWRTRAAYAQPYRMTGFVEAKNAVKWDYQAPEGDLELRVTFHEPNKRTRDLDGLLSACKPAIDGIANALAVDDKRFNPIQVSRGEIIKGGKVVIEIRDGTLGW